MRFLGAIFALCVGAFAATSTSQTWEKGQTFLGFLSAHNIPLSVYWNLHNDDKELTAEIYAGVRYYTLKDEAGALIQALIPLNDDTQIHIFRESIGETSGESALESAQNSEIRGKSSESSGGESKSAQNGGSSESYAYKIDFIPVKYFSSTNSIAISIQKSPYQDLAELTGSANLANEFINIHKNAIDFSRSVHKGDKLALIYTHKSRLGRSFGTPEIKASLIETAKKPNFLFAFSDGRYYDQNGKEITGLSLSSPLSARISSRFSHSRLHPILKVRRPHYGVDYAAAYGSSVRAASAGRVVFAGQRGGYGKVVEIAHANGLRTLYAHLSAINTSAGKSVKVGQTIGKVGNSGLSTGAHLHFGLYKNNKPINPLANIRSTRELDRAQKGEFLAIAREFEGQLKDVVKKHFSGEEPSYFALDSRLDSRHDSAFGAQTGGSRGAKTNAN